MANSKSGNAAKWSALRCGIACTVVVSACGVEPLDPDDPALELGEVALASTADCDGTGVVGRFRVVGWSSFDSKGRRIELQNETLLDRFSRAEIKTGFQQGDLVWIDRSINEMPLNPQHFRDDARVRNLGGGWKQCGPFNVFRTQSVFSWHRAVRACWRPPGGPSECGEWNVDQ
jgi:hypothetical protein